jgi:hypothetical protein
MAPDNAAQLFVRLLMVILIVSGTPVRSLLISLLTSEEGDFVGKGPAVSMGDVEQEPDVVVSVLPSVLVLEEAVLSFSFLHALANGATDANPRAAMKPFFKKSFLSI